jgi:hypothetical protein
MSYWKVRGICMSITPSLISSCSNLNLYLRFHRFKSGGAMSEGGLMIDTSRVWIVIINIRHPHS